MDFLITGGLFAAIAALWQQIQSVFFQIRSVLIVTINIEHQAVEPLLVYLNVHYKTYPLGARVYHGQWMNLRSGTTRKRVVAWETIGFAGMVYYKKWKAVLIGQVDEKQKTWGYGSDHVSHPSTLSLSYFRWNFKDSDEIIKAACDFYNTYIDEESKHIKDRFFIRNIVGSTKMFSANNNSDIQQHDTREPTSSGDSTDVRSYRSARPVNYKREEIGSSSSYATLENLALSKAASDVVKELYHWKEMEHWYREKGLVWRFGIGLHGQPGTGKSAFTRAVGESLDMPIFVYDLASLSNEEFITSWQKMLSSAPCIALIEDIDAVFDGRKTIAGLLTFDCLLNCISGVESTDGLIVVVTTNYINKVDPALGISDNGISSRPGRLDRIVEMTSPDEAGRRKIAARILGANDLLTESLVAKGDGMTGAQFQDTCIKRVLDKNP